MNNRSSVTVDAIDISEDIHRDLFQQSALMFFHVWSLRKITRRIQKLSVINIYLLKKRATIREALYTCLFATLPKDYKKEAKHCFYQVTSKEDRILKEAFLYFIEGWKYRLSTVIDLLYYVYLQLITTKEREGVN